MNTKPQSAVPQGESKVAKTSREPDYSWSTVEEYEKCSGFSVNDAFRIGWNMARTTDTMLGIKPDAYPSREPAVPQGLPAFDELDDEVIDAACTLGSLYRVDLMRAYECIRAMLAATPAAPSQPAVPDVELRPEDFTVEVIVTPMGGFNPNVTHGVRVTHKPTGLSVSCDSERSQHKNRHIAFEQLKEMLADHFKIAPQPAAPQGEPAAQVSDLFPSIRTKLYEMGFEPESPLYTAPADEPATPPYHRDLWGISHAIARINQAEYIAAFTLDQETVTLKDEWAECKRISELPEVDEALRLFAEGETTEDQAVAIVQTIIAALREKKEPK